MIDRGRVLQRGTAAELAAAPASAFVADFAGASVLTGEAAPGERGLTRVALDGGGVLVSTDRFAGRAGASVFPWEVTLEPADAPPHGSAQNSLRATVTSITPVGNRVRVGLDDPSAAGRRGDGGGRCCAWACGAGMRRAGPLEGDRDPAHRPVEK